MDYLPQELIRKKRDGLALNEAEVQAFITYANNGHMSDSQIAAMAMAIFLNDMDRKETIALTLAMRDSGTILDWPNSDRPHLDQPLIDKHSTGGVGDGVSLMLAPLAASCGLLVPMISGRGLGHTGGTLDKLEAIPGYNVSPDVNLFRSVISHAGCAIISQTANLAPADKKIYAIRDITATVESIPLIVASILSKKLASGLEGLVLDVKCGNGATTSDVDEARKLARVLVDVACGAGLPTQALITDMNEPLSSAIGNAIEIKNTIEFLTGAHRDPRLMRVIIQLTANMLVAGGLTKDHSTADMLAQTKLESGHAAEVFGKMVQQLGGPLDLLENYPALLPRSSLCADIIAQSDGWITGYKTRDLGMEIVKLGGGRSHPTDKIDYSVGLSDLHPIGTKISKGDRLALAHVNSQEQLQNLKQNLDEIITIGHQNPQTYDPILDHITASE
jgi:thymidine phosphorylase